MPLSEESLRIFLEGLFGEVRALRLFDGCADLLRLGRGCRLVGLRLAKGEAMVVEFENRSELSHWDRAQGRDECFNGTHQLDRIV